MSALSTRLSIWQEHSQALAVQARTLEQFQRYGMAEEAVSHTAGK